MVTFWHVFLFYVAYIEDNTENDLNYEKFIVYLLKSPRKEIFLSGYFPHNKDAGLWWSLPIILSCFSKRVFQGSRWCMFPKFRLWIDLNPSCRRWSD